MNGIGHNDKSMNPEDSKLSRLYHAAAEEMPSASLDAAILAASKKAVSSGPRAAGLFGGRWPAGFAVAATIVVAVIILPGLFQKPGQEADLRVQGTGQAVDQKPADTGIDSTAFREQNMRSPERPVVAPVEAMPQSKQIHPMRQYSMEKAPVASGMVMPREVMKKSRPVVSSKRKQFSTLARSSPESVGKHGPSRSTSPSAAEGNADSSVPLQNKAGSDANEQQQILTWLRIIRQYIKAGNIKVARTLLRQFVKTYPDYLLPKDVESLVPR